MSRCTKTRVLVVAGGSGGHIFPAVAFCQELKSQRPDSVDLFFLTAAGQKAKGWIPSEIRTLFLKINRRPWGLTKLLCYSIFLTLKIRPDVVFGFGGYMSVPFVILAKALGAKTIIHEQNVVPGRANQFLSDIAGKVAITFPGTERFFKKREKVFLTRYPLRRALVHIDKKKALEFFNFAEGLFTILVAGGSQGAATINKKFLKALRENKNLGSMQIIHLTGNSDFSYVQQCYGDLSVRSKVVAFLNEMNYAYCAADLVISRSGAGTLMEIMHFALPSILIPYPYAGSHQIENARFLGEKGGAILLEEGSLTPQMINGLLDIFMNDRIRRKTMSSIVRSLADVSERPKLSNQVFL